MQHAITGTFFDNEDILPFLAADLDVTSWIDATHDTFGVQVVPTDDAKMLALGTPANLHRFTVDIFYGDLQAAEAYLRRNRTVVGSSLDPTPDYTPRHAA